jgi:transglutaminase-like putative cysteine protease
MRRLLYHITHETIYEYLGGVSISHHTLKLLPRDNEKQRLLASELVVDPLPGVVSRHVDYFGNTTHFITVEGAHTRLLIRSQAEVAIGPAFIPEPGETPAWEHVRTLCRGDHSGRALEAHEFTYPSPLAPVRQEFADYAAASFPAQRPLLEGVLDITRRIGEDFAFDPEATHVATPVHEVFARRRGVCQDFAQFQIACLRSLGLPARYVSGYLETDPPPGQPKLRGVDASHAWVAFYCPGIGWIDVDPTNNCLPSMRHITVAWGRDYGDVSPLKGVLMGGQGQTLEVAVDVVAQGMLETEN